MIVISLMGGLGNQMFQYASARRLALIHDTPLRIDASNFHKRTKNREHNLQLDQFNLSAPQASRDELKGYRIPQKRVRRVRNFIARTLGFPKANGEAGMVYEEPAGSAFKKEFFQLGPDVYLLGYFNSYKYFNDIREILAEEFTPRYPVGEKTREMVAQIENSPSVAIHVRRGDYVTDPDVRRCLEGIITDEYYHNALEVIGRRVPSPHFYVFSNDMPWVRSHFILPGKVTYVDINPPQRGFEDLWMMSRCRHNITAGGSTFSWWAAYLNPHPDKIVVRTEKISNDPAYNHPEDYFPPEWEAVPS